MKLREILCFLMSVKKKCDMIFPEYIIMLLIYSFSYDANGEFVGRGSRHASVCVQSVRAPCVI